MNTSTERILSNKNPTGDSQMNTQTNATQAASKRRDPMKEIVDFDCLEAAHMLVLAKQDEAYWKTHAVPQRPMGVVRHEALRQVLTFVLPLLLMSVAFVLYGVRGLLAAAPLGWLVGYLWDRQLCKAIAAKLTREEDLDRGRFKRVAFLSERLGLKPEDITLAMVQKMSADYLKLKPYQAVIEAEKSRIRMLAEAYYDGKSKVPTARQTARSHSGKTSTHPGYNPTTGLAMTPGGVFDVGGNFHNAVQPE